MDIFKEDMVAFSEGRKLPRSPTYKQLKNWSTIGVKGRSGKRVYLEVAKVGGELCTSKQAYQRFCDEATAEEREVVADE